MRQDQIDRFKARLLAMEEQLGHRLDYLMDEIETMAYEGGLPTDAVPELFDEEVTLLDAERGTWEQVECALRRVASGAYGVCPQCKKEISLEELDAIPYRTICASCTSRRNHPQRPRFETLPSESYQ